MIAGFFVQAQNSILTIYYDKNWRLSVKDSATFYSQCIKKDSSYLFTAYWMKSNKLNKICMYADSLLKKPRGLILGYYESGKLRDSAYINNSGKFVFMYSFYENGKTESSDVFDSLGQITGRYTFYESGKVQDSNTFDNSKHLLAYRYYENGKLFFRVYEDYNLKTTKTEAYDTTGKIIPDFVYEKEAEFPGGNQAWVRYLTSNMNRDIMQKYYNSNATVTANVIIKFLVDKQGYITDTEINKSSGIKEVDQDALNVIKNSPRWINGIQYNKPVNSYRLQPITYTAN
jgi:TonB family protein